MNQFSIFIYISINLFKSTHVNRFGHNSCGRKRYQATEENNESTDHKSSRCDKKEKQFRFVVKYYCRRILSADSYTNYPQHLLIKHKNTD